MKKILTALMLAASIGAAHAQGRPTILAAFEGTCKCKLIAGWFPCSPKVGDSALPNGRSFVQFEAEDKQFAFSGGYDRQPDINDLFLTVDTVRILRGGRQLAIDDRMEGECHLVFNDDASAFESVHCDAWDRAKGRSHDVLTEHK